MKRVGAVIGGEGNGGIIYPELHYVRDALVGTALFLSLLAEKQVSVSDLRANYPSYFMSKNKINLKDNVDLDNVLNKITTQYKNQKISIIDGIKIDFDDGWVHLRKSNTEKIIRIYTEAKSTLAANSLAKKFISEIKSFL